MTDRHQPGACQITAPGLCTNPSHDHSTWPPMHPTAPDATAGDGLREVIARGLAPRTWDILLPRHRERLYADAAAILALPALRDVLAAAARDAEKVARVTELADEFSAGPDMQGQLYDGAYVADVFRAALDGTP